jgi:hypothetical protein
MEGLVMGDTLSEKLYAAYPKLFDGGIYFECGPGWFPLVYNLCGMIEQESKHRAAQIERIKIYHATHQDNPPKFIEEMSPVVVLQIKEKFGGLRFYYSGGDETIRYYVAAVEYLSEKTCEECGQPGQLYRDGWFKTLCPVHANEQDRSNENITELL